MAKEYKTRKTYSHTQNYCLVSRLAVTVHIPIHNKVTPRSKYTVVQERKFATMNPHRLAQGCVRIVKEWTRERQPILEKEKRTLEVCVHHGKGVIHKVDSN